MLTFDLAINWDELDGPTISKRTHSLIMTLAQQGRLADLVTLLQKQRPKVNWSDVPSSKQQQADMQSMISDAERNEALQNYLTAMNNIKESNKYNIELAQAHTSSVLPYLDKARLITVIKFLVHSEMGMQYFLLGSADLSHTNLEKLDLSGANFSNVNLEGANLESANLSRVNFTEANLQEANLRSVKLIKAKLDMSNLTNTDLSYTDLTNASFFQANMSNTNLRHTKVQAANFQHANLCGAKFGNSKKISNDRWLLRYLVTGSILDSIAGVLLFKDRKFDEASFRDAKYDRLTQWPDEFYPIVAGAIQMKK